MPYPVRIELQCLRLERMLSEEIVVTEMAVNVCVSREQDMMALVTLKNTWDIICTDSRPTSFHLHLVSIKLFILPIKMGKITWLSICNISTSFL